MHLYFLTLLSSKVDLMVYLHSHSLSNATSIKLNQLNCLSNKQQTSTLKNMFMVSEEIEGLIYILVLEMECTISSEERDSYSCVDTASNTNVAVLQLKKQWQAFYSIC